MACTFGVALTISATKQVAVNIAIFHDKRYIAYKQSCNITEEDKYHHRWIVCKRTLHDKYYKQSRHELDLEKDIAAEICLEKPRMQSVDRHIQLEDSS